MQRYSKDHFYAIETNQEMFPWLKTVMFVPKTLWEFYVTIYGDTLWLALHMLVHGLKKIIFLKENFCKYSSSCEFES